MGTGPRAGSGLVLDFMQDRFHHKSPGEFESAFIKAGTVKQRKGLGYKAKGPWTQDRGLAWNKLLVPRAPLTASLVGTLRA